MLDHGIRTTGLFRRPRAATVRGKLKRSFDAVFALLLLSAMMPVLVVVAIAIKLDSPGPVLYRARRVGHRGKPLILLKFRKMHHGAKGAPLTVNADERLTRVGKVLARSRLDELPQLWDVFRGRMSIVGPRPEDPAFVALHSDAYELILSVRPGITGLSQLAFAQEHKILDKDDPVADYIARILPPKIGLDILYARSYRIRTDIVVLCWTLAAVLLRVQVAVHRSTGRMNIRRRPQPAGSIAIRPAPQPSSRTRPRTGSASSSIDVKAMFRRRWPDQSDSIGTLVDIGPERGCALEVRIHQPLRLSSGTSTALPPARSPQSSTAVVAGRRRR